MEKKDTVYKQAGKQVLADHNQTKWIFQETEYVVVQRAICWRHDKDALKADSMNVLQDGNGDRIGFD